MFNISYKLNQKADIAVIFADNKMCFENLPSFISKDYLHQMNLFKDEFSINDFLILNLVRKNKKISLLIVKIKDSVDEYEFQKIGGLVFGKISKSKSANIFLDTYKINKSFYNKFVYNFFLGLLSKSYAFSSYKIKKKNKSYLINYLSIISEINLKNSINDALHVYNGIKKTRDLVTYPANILNPKKFTKFILDLKKIGLVIEILDEKKLKSLGMHALLGVGQGSVNESYLAIMKWNGSKNSQDRPLAFVGKGVCFDTGGISLKPAKFMEDMKYDMGGAGTVVGLMKTLALRKAKINAVGVVGLVENMVDGNSQRPGDVVKSYSGQSIEILNTDAEGRLVLADAIAYTEDKFKPKFIINLATLTGAIVVSLGNEYAGLFSNDDNLANQIYETSLKDNEKTWRLPLHENYDRLMDSKIADMQNINYSGGAGSITAAQFLQRFIRNKTPWAHLDIAGMAWIKKNTDVTPEGATGYGVKLLNRLVKEHYEK